MGKEFDFTKMAREQNISLGTIGSRKAPDVVWMKKMIDSLKEKDAELVVDNTGQINSSKSPEVESLSQNEIDRLQKINLKTRSF